jgi:hypothetical protein
MVLVYFLQELHAFVLWLGLNPTALEVGTAGFLHEALYNKLASVYNNATNDLPKSVKSDNDIYITSGAKEDTKGHLQ